MITLRVPPHRRHAARLLAVTVLWAVPATAQRTPQRASTPPTTQQGGALLRIVPPRRLPTDSEWRTAWQALSDSLDDRFVEVRQLIMAGPVAVALDMGTREVNGIDPATGAERFVLTARGLGPGEFSRPRHLVTTPDGFAVWDAAASRLTAFAPNGAPLWNTTLTIGTSFSGLCVTSGRLIHVITNRHDSSVVTFNAAGRLVATRSIRWATLPPKLPSYAYVGTVSGNAAGTHCAFAPRFGGEWAVIPATGPIRIAPLIAPGPPPEVQSREVSREKSLRGPTVIITREESTTPPASAHLAWRGDTVFILAAQPAHSPQKILDAYDSRTGAYLHSRLLPTVALNIALSPSGLMLVATMGDEVSGLYALSTFPSPSSARRPSRK